MAVRSGNMELVRRGIENHKFMPDGKLTPKKKMARLIYDENKLSFKDEEAVRIIIQKLTGKSGKNMKNVIPDKSLFEDE
ncbi:MAG TPA: hypothetical protein VGK46_14685, partial [Saprospiraceae bacterium]